MDFHGGGEAGSEPPGTVSGRRAPGADCGLWIPPLPHGSLPPQPLTASPLPLSDLMGEAETTEEVMNFPKNDNVFGIVPVIQSVLRERF